MDEVTPNYWRKCSSCKKSIGLKAKYYVCSVSTCNGQRTGYAFCSIACFETHLPGARHRDAGAIEMTAPAVSGEIAPSLKSQSTAASGGEVLIIASRLKDYITERSGGYNTSASVMDVLSQHVRILCQQAIDNARADGRRTVMDRDFQFLHELIKNL